jgi:hypothetical protein
VFPAFSKAKALNLIPILCVAGQCYSVAGGDLALSHARFASALRTKRWLWDGFSLQQLPEWVVLWDCYSVEGNGLALSHARFASSLLRTASVDVVVGCGCRWCSVDHTWSASFLVASRLGTAATHLVGVVCVVKRKKVSSSVVVWGGAEDISYVVVQEGAVWNLLLVVEGCLLSARSSVYVLEEIVWCR